MAVLPSTINEFAIGGKNHLTTKPEVGVTRLGEILAVELALQIFGQFYENYSNSTNLGGHFYTKKS
jgi:hypothetical protein